MFAQQHVTRLAEENRQFVGTGGVSENNAKARFAPAFLDSSTGRVEISRFADGRPAPFHLLDGMPEEWIVEKDLKGRVIEIKQEIVSGFVRLGKFFTRQQAADFMKRCA